MGAAQVGSIDAVQDLGGGRTDDAFVHQPSGFGKDFALPFDVCRFAQWAGKHKFPMQRQAFAFERVHVQRFRVVNQRDSALRGDKLDDLRQMAVGMIGGKTNDGAPIFNAAICSAMFS